MSSDDAIKTVAKGSVIFSIGLLYSYFTAYAYRLLIARWLGPGDYGLISLGFAVIGLVGGVLSLGLHSGINRYAAYYGALKDKSRVKGVFMAAIKILLPITLACAALVYLSAGWLATNVFHNAALTPILKLFAITIPLMTLMKASLQIVLAFKKAKYEVYSRNFIENTVKLGVTVLLLALGFKIMGAAFAYVLSICAATVASVYFMKKTFPMFSRKIKPTYNYKELITFSLPLLFVQILAPLMGWIDTLLIGIFLDSRSVGVYNAALPTAQLTKLFFPALTAIIIPVFTGLYALRKVGEIQRVYKTVARWIFIASLPIVLITVLFARRIINLLFGVEYLAATASLVILSVGYFIYLVVGPARHMLNVLGKTKYVLLNYIIAVSVNVAGNLILIPRLGITGAAISTAASFVLINLLAFIEVKAWVKLAPFDKNWLKPVCSAVISAVVFFIVLKYLLGSNSIALIFGLAGFVILYGVLLLAFRTLTKDDIMILKAIRSKTGIKSHRLEAFLRRFI